MNLNHHTNTFRKVVGAIAATSFLSVIALLPQAAFSQQSPGDLGAPRVDEPNTNNQTNDPSRPVNDSASPSLPVNTVPDRSNSNFNNQENKPGQMNNTDQKSKNAGESGSAENINFDQARPLRPANRIERYTQPGATDPRFDAEYVPTANSTEESNTNNSNSRMNNMGVSNGNSGINGTVDNRGNDRYTAPNSNFPGRGTYTTPRSQVPNSGVDTGTSGTVNNPNQ